MSDFETFDDAHSLVRARARMRHVLVGFAVVSLIVAAMAPILAIWADGAAWVPLAATGVLTIHAAGCIRALTRHRKRVWRLAASGRHVVALDVGRHQRTIAWVAVERIDVDDDGLTLVARGLAGEAVQLRVSSTFESYVALSHRLVALAERRRIEIWVDGRPWEMLPIDGLVETLRDDVAGEAR